MAETPDPVGTPTPGETPNPEAPSNNATPTAAPVANAVDPAEVERLRKEKEQSDLRIRQLENEKAAAQKAEDERKAKELEDTQQFKTLYEQEKAEKERLEAEKLDNAKRAEVKAESDKVLSEFSPEVRKLAETTGLSLPDTDEASISAFKAKLDEVKGMVGGKTVSPNNPNTPAPQKPTIENAEGKIEGELVGAKFDEIAQSMPGIKSMMGELPE